MNQPLDNFFREKLEHAHKPAPVAAWDRIDAGLQGKQRKGLWLKIAASLLIVTTATCILWPGQQETDGTRLAKRPAQETDPVVQKHTPLSDPVPQEQVATPASPAHALAITPAPSHSMLVKKQHPAASQNIDKPERDQQPVAYESYQVPQAVITEPAPVHESIVPVQPAPASANVVLSEADTEEETDEAVTLVYSADEINEKYLDKEALEKATSAQKKPSTFRKLLEKAYDLKNNQDPMGGLRQRKNEILALSFKSEKRSQNK